MADESHWTEYKKNGLSRKRIKGLKAKQCCNQGCVRKFQRTKLWAVLTLFWGLSKSVQDCLLPGPQLR